MARTRAANPPAKIQRAREGRSVQASAMASRLTDSRMVQAVSQNRVVRKMRGGLMAQRNPARLAAALCGDAAADVHEDRDSGGSEESLQCGEGEERGAGVGVGDGEDCGDEGGVAGGEEGGRAGRAAEGRGQAVAAMREVASWSSSVAWPKNHWSEWWVAESHTMARRKASVSVVMGRR